MNIIRSFEELESIKEDIVCALGTFDGLHRGHQKVINAMIERAKKRNAKSMVITFSQHPLEFLQPHKKISLLMEDKVRKEVLSAKRIDFLFLIPINKEFLQIEPEDFITLLSKSCIKEVFVGTNFSFGNQGKGTPNTLFSLGKNKGIHVHSLELLKDEMEGVPISSTLIRHHIEQGHMETATSLLGRPFAFYGTVIYGDQRGRLLGFPTINFQLSPKLVCPPDGVYVNRLFFDGKWYNGIGNIGDNPTFENQFHRFETHILDFEGNLYGREIYVEFLYFIRPELKFNSLDKLIEQMADDKRKTIAYLDNLGLV